MGLRGLRYIALGLIASAAFAFNANADDYIIHEVKNGETLFGIAKKYDINSDQLLELNPQAVTGVKKGMKLRIPADGSAPTPNQSKPKQTTPASQQSQSAVTAFPTEYTVKEAQESGVHVPPEAAQAAASVLEAKTYCAGQGDTFATIARKTGVSEDTLIELNPFLDPDNLIAGTMVRLTEDAPYYNETPTESPTEAPTAVVPSEMPQLQLPGQDIEGPTLQDPLQATIDSTYHDTEHLNVLIALPFMANSEEPSRQARNYADFYRGLLIAAKEMTTKPGNDIEVITIDVSADGLENQLSDVIDRDLAVIIAPEDTRQLQSIIDYATPRDIYVLNMFNFSDENFKSNPYVLQGNINQQRMYDKAISYLLNTYPDYVPVILAPAEAKEEKEPFVRSLKEAYEAAGKTVVELPFEEGLSEDLVLTTLDPTQSYIFLPKSGSQTVFNRFAPALLNLQAQENGKERFRLFGYPDWIAYRGESLDLLQRLDAVIYSRFLSDEKDLENKDLQTKFIEWYGQPMIEAVPSQGLLGYDTGRYLFYALQHGTFESRLKSTLPFRGIQNSFKFTRDSEGAGYVNDVLYIIQFLPGDNYRVQQL